MSDPFGPVTSATRLPYSCGYRRSSFHAAAVHSPFEAACSIFASQPIAARPSASFMASAKSESAFIQRANVSSLKPPYRHARRRVEPSASACTSFARFSGVRTVVRPAIIHRRSSRGTQVPQRHTVFIRTGRDYEVGTSPERVLTKAAVIDVMMPAIELPDKARHIGMQRHLHLRLR